MKSYKEFYDFMYVQLDGASDMNWEDYPSFDYSASIFYEFICECFDYNIKFILNNFDLEKIKQQKNLDDYKWNIIIETLLDFTKEYPNNSIEFINN